MMAMQPLTYAVFPTTVACEYGPMAAGALSVEMIFFSSGTDVADLTSLMSAIPM